MSGPTVGCKSCCEQLKGEVMKRRKERADRSVPKTEPSQAYFWTKEWQEGEREAEVDIKAGRVKTFNSLEDFFKDLNG